MNLRLIRGLGALGVLAVFCAASAKAENKKVLMFTKSQGFQHSVVKRGDNGELSMAEKIVTELGKKNGFDVTATKDGSLINAENLKKYDAVYFFTQGEIDQVGLDKQPPIKQEEKEAILEYVKNGGGFVGTHCGGADTYHAWVVDGKRPFLEMVGGEFIGHGIQQESRVDVVDPNFPAMKGWPKSLTITDEWYAYRDFHANMHILMLLETEGMAGPLYKRQPYPIAWCSNYGKGRVFYTGMGHREDVWEHPLYQSMVLNGILWAAGAIPGDATPNLKQIYGDEKQALERINPTTGGK
ncbi:MAG: ThuA domain-containing protein [Planctomycetota bacterium]